MNKILIGITGITGDRQIAGCGKDTVSDMLAEMTHATVYGLADPIYAMVKAGFGIDGKAIDWNNHSAKNAQIEWLSTEQPVSLRSMLETLGTEWGRRHVDKDVWLKLAEKAYQESEYGLIIKDIRFPNERDWLDSVGGKLVYVYRPGNHGNATAGHASNIPLDYRRSDIMLINDCDLNELRIRVKCLCQANEWFFKHVN